jgi:hypothetical protein
MAPARSLNEDLNRLKTSFKPEVRYVNLTNRRLGLKGVIDEFTDSRPQGGDQGCAAIS